MDLQMNGKTALVTGGSAGIGKATAFALAREGVDVAICARRKEPLEAAASQIARETNRKILAIPADLTKPAGAEAFVKDAHTALGRIDILVNNAGSAPGGVLDFLTEEHWAQSLQLKFMGYVRCLKHVLPIMQKQGRGRVVNLIGNDGVKPSYWEIAPRAANAAGQNLTLALAAQFLGFGLFARFNTTVTVALLVGARSVAGAIFLILELSEPYRGLMRISDEPLRNAMAQIDRLGSFTPVRLTVAEDKENCPFQLRGFCESNSAPVGRAGHAIHEMSPL
jgi:NADP-dependent 3-hydroxy acid dehydrogenase YdfG